MRILLKISKNWLIFVMKLVFPGPRHMLHFQLNEFEILMVLTLAKK